MSGPQGALDFDAARARRDDGAQRAADHADRVEPGPPPWSESAYEFLKACAAVLERPFLAEEIVALARTAGVASPTDSRSWGAVFQRAARARLIEKVGYAPAATSNCSPKVQWRFRHDD